MTRPLDSHCERGHNELYQKKLLKGQRALDNSCDTAMPRVCRGDLDLLPDSAVERLTKAANALADPIRVQMVQLLGQQPDLCTCEFEELLGLGQSKVSYHLRILLEAGIVTRETHGTWSHYSLRNSGILDRLRALVAEGVLVA